MTESRGFGPRNEFRGGSGGFLPKPVEVGKEYDVDIQEMSRRGEGVARLYGLVIFVRDANAGEHVRVRITRISRRFAEAQVVGKREAKAGSEQ